MPLPLGAARRRVAVPLLLAGPAAGLVPLALRSAAQEVEPPATVSDGVAGFRVVYLSASAWPRAGVA